MNIDFSTKLTDVFGAPLNEGKFTLGDASVQGLLSAKPKEGEVSGTDLVRRHRLAIQIVSAKAPLDVAPEDVVLIREVIASVYQNPVVVGPAWTLLEGR